MPEMFLRRLREKYKTFYDVKEQPSCVSLPLDIYARFHQRHEKYFATKKINIWRLDHEEHCLVKYYEHLTKKDLEEMIALLKSSIPHLTKPHPDHLKTIITGVLVTKTPLSSNLQKSITAFKHSKAFKFYLHGWCDLRLIHLDLFTQQVTTNPAGQEVKKFYQFLFEKNNNMEIKEVSL